MLGNYVITALAKDGAYYLASTKRFTRQVDAEIHIAYMRAEYGEDATFRIELWYMGDVPVTP
jgi:hypothetical protein